MVTIMVMIIVTNDNGNGNSNSNGNPSTFPTVAVYVFLVCCSFAQMLHYATEIFFLCKMLHYVTKKTAIRSSFFAR